MVSVSRSSRHLKASNNTTPRLKTHVSFEYASGFKPKRLHDVGA